MRSDDERGRAASLAGAVRRRAKSGARKGGRGAKAGLLSLGERFIESAPRIPVRDLATLRTHFPGLGPEEIADRLIGGAVKGTAIVGAGIGAAAMLPTPLAMPAELATETFAVAAVEFKLIAELHEIYGLRAPGTTRQRATAYLTAWTEQRGIQVFTLSSVNVALGGKMKKELRRRLLKRTVRNFPTLSPFMVGAAIGAMINRRATAKLAECVRRDLRAHQIPWEALPPAESPREVGRGGSRSPG